MKTYIRSFVLSFSVPVVMLLALTQGVAKAAETTPAVFDSYKFSQAIQDEIARLNAARSTQTVLEQINDFRDSALANITRVGKDGVSKSKLDIFRSVVIVNVQLYTELNNIDLIIDHRISTIQQTARNMKFFHLSREAVRLVGNGTAPYLNAVLFFPALAIDIVCTPLVSVVLLIDYIFDSTIY